MITGAEEIIMGIVSHFTAVNYTRTPNVAVHFDYSFFLCAMFIYVYVAVFSYLPMEQNRQIVSKINKSSTISIFSEHRFSL